MTSSLLVLLLLSQAERPATAMPSPLAASTAGGWRYLTRLEVTGLALLPDGGVGGVEGYAQLTPVLVVDGGEAFGLNLGAPVRLRLAGGEVGAGLVRREDWGQLVHALKLGSDTSPVGLWVGALEGYSLLSGHLVRRYSNRANPDYHPAGASLTGTLGPLYVEAFASDVLGARLMGAQAEVDLQHLFTGPPRQRGRYTLGVSAVHDWGRAGGASPPVTLAHLDGTAVVVVRPGFELHVLGGWGGRPGGSGAWGAVAGVGADALSATLDMKLRLEVRRQHGGFRQGYFGPDYELGRLSAPGTPGLPQAQAHLEVALNGLALGLGQPEARHLYSGQVRWRFGHKLYALAEGGTLLYPTPDGTLRPGAYASLGLGVDNAR